MKPRQQLAGLLAETMLAGHLEEAGLVDRAAAILERRPRWLRPMVRRLLAHFGPGRRPRRFRLERFIAADQGFAGDVLKFKSCCHPNRDVRPQMVPALGPPCSWPLPPLCTPGELARWLNLDLNELFWFADLRTLEGQLPPGPLRHYHYRWLAKRDGSARLIESPKQRLKAIQRHLLTRILDQIPPHEAAHGFRVGHSVGSFVAPHVHQAMVLRLDLQDFFPTITRARILAIFLTAGYPEPVAALLAGLCTNTSPRTVLAGFSSSPTAAVGRSLELIYRRPHLPQGAPTSPALANLAAYRLDCRLAGYARAAGACYTRYADDLVFSGGPEFARGVERFYIRVAAIVLEEGFAVHTRKTRIMPPSVSQRAAGIVLNAHPNLPRPAFDELKATLHNCVRHGPAGQNRAGLPDFHAHLAGRIAHWESINPARGQKLRREFDRIVWPADPAGGS